MLMVQDLKAFRIEADTFAGMKKRILVIEDDPVMAHVCQRLLI